VTFLSNTNSLLIIKAINIKVTAVYLWRCARQ